MQQKTIDNIALVIIDQLRIDYKYFMPLCSGLLPFCVPCDTNSYPSSTEPTHATLSTATPPGVHGFVSKQTIHGETGLSELEDKFDSGRIVPIALSAKENGFYTYVIGGKPETVRVMGRREDCGIRILYDQDQNSFQIDGTDKDKVSFMSDILKNEEYNKSLRRTEQDDKILNLLTEVMSYKTRTNNLYIACLPGLDEIGHIYGPGSNAVKKHLANLDEKLAFIINEHNHNTSFIITGDHGCRNICKYIVEIEHDVATMAVYKEAGEILNFVESYTLESRGDIRKIQYDGGNLRIWFKHSGGQLTPDDQSFLQRYGELQPSRDEKKRGYHANSDHRNQGEVAIIANPDVMFCKKMWVHNKEARSKISGFMDLNRDDLPRGEHGTYHDEDRMVAFISDYDFGLKKIPNTIVPVLVRQLME